jgi:hypothetical protein
MRASFFTDVISRLPWQCPFRRHKNFQLTWRGVAAINTPSNTTVSLKPIEITTHTVFEEYPTPLMGDHDLLINADDVREKPSGLCLDKDVECGV